MSSASARALTGAAIRPTHVPARSSASRSSRRRSVVARASSSSSSSSSPSSSDDAPRLGRRASLASAVVAAALAPPALAADADAPTIVSETPGFGAKAAKSGDLVLVNYVATLADGTTVDTTLGGATYFTNGDQKSVQPAEPRPVIVKVNGADPVPGIPRGLKRGVEGMRVGGVRVLSIPPALGFGDAPVRSPYALVPGGSTLTYEVTVLRLSDAGPDALFKDVAGCGLGGANTMTNGCAAIVPEE